MVKKSLVPMVTQVTGLVTRWLQLQVFSYFLTFSGYFLVFVTFLVTCVTIDAIDFFSHWLYVKFRHNRFCNHILER